MRRVLVWHPGLALGLLAAACASYTPAPVRPDSQLEPFNRRRLDDPGLLAWLDSSGGGRPDSAWTARQLALAATWFRPERARRAAEVRAADARMRSAGARPGPGLSTDLEYAFSDPQSSSRWGVALAALFTVELGGKRGARIARARAQAMAVRAAAAEDEWELASRSYVAAFAWAHADRALALAREERAALDTLVGLSLARYREGSIGRLELARVQTEAGVAAMAEAAAERAVAVVRAELAAATGVPVDALGGARVSVPVLPGCAGADTMSRLSLQQEALGARWALRRAAAEYQAAEGDLRVEVANASPDLTLGPGMFFDQGTGKFTLASAVPSIPLGRNRGPIAEAEARRAAAGAHLAEVQEQVLAELESGLAACGAGGRSFQTVDSLARTVAERVRLARAAYDRGETGRLDVAVAELELRRVRRQRMELEAELAGAGLALERSRGAWGLRADGPWPAAVPWWPLNTGEE